MPVFTKVLFYRLQKYSVRIRSDLYSLTSRGLTIADLRNAISQAN